MFHTSLALVLFLFPLAYSPGPGNLFFAANGARFGFRATLPASAGYHIATWMVTAAIGVGALAALDRVPAALITLKIAGVGYIFWLAWKMLRSDTLKGQKAARPASFWDGVVLLILNPKAYVIVALMFAQFLGPSDAASGAQVFLITTVFTLNNLLAFSLWTVVGDKIAGAFRTTERTRLLNTAFGLALGAVAVWMMLS